MATKIIVIAGKQRITRDVSSSTILVQIPISAKPVTVTVGLAESTPDELKESAKRQLDIFEQVKGSFA
jgi:hypothetical protein